MGSSHLFRVPATPGEKRAASASARRLGGPRKAWHWIAFVSAHHRTFRRAMRGLTTRQEVVDEGGCGCDGDGSQRGGVSAREAWVRGALVASHLHIFFSACAVSHLTPRVPWGRHRANQRRPRHTKRQLRPSLRLDVSVASVLPNSVVRRRCSLGVHRRSLQSHISSLSS